MIVVRSEIVDGVGRLVTQELSDPNPGAGEVVLRVAGAGINRADLLQVAGRYNVPPGATDVLGLEASGTVIAVGDGVDPTWRGREVVALVASGGYATHLAVDVRNVLPAPERVGLLEAGGVLEVAATAVSNLLLVARFQRGETVLIHGATGGVGAFAIQLIAALGGRVAVTASSGEKLDRARMLGAQILINYAEEDFAQRMAEVGGADVILDTVAGGYLGRNLQALAVHGRIVTIGMQGGRQDELDFGVLLQKKASVIGTLLRDRPIEEKAAILAETERVAWPLLSSGQIQHQTDSVFALLDASSALDRMRSGDHVGKIVLDCRDDAISSWPQIHPQVPEGA